MTDPDQRFPSPPELPGEAPPDRYGCNAESGDVADPTLAVFPIVRYDPQSRMHLLGTGFFITTNGIFVTARHVLLEPFDQRGRQKYPIGILQFIKGSTYLQRPILRCTSHPRADVTVGVAAPMNRAGDGEPLSNPILTLTLIRPNLGARVVTYAYPKHSNIVLPDGTQSIQVWPTYYDGEVTEYFPAGRDRALLPAPCYQTSICVHGGASGGPVFCSSGRVFGVNSTGIGGTDVSFVSRIDDIFGLLIHDVSIAGAAPKPVRIHELARLGHISVRPPL